MDATPPGEGEAKRRRRDSPAGVAQITGDDALYTIELYGLLAHTPAIIISTRSA